MSDKIFVIGHKTPDLDSVAAAISYANYKNKIENTDKYIPAMAGEANKATEFVLDKFGFAKPEILTNANGQRLILVDHNEESQQVDGNGKQIIEILDHHKLNFVGIDPIRIDIWPIGSSNSIIYNKYQEAGIEPGRNLAGLMLSAVLDDTVITKSPTCTTADKEIIKKLAKLAGIDDWENYGIEIFKAKADVSAMSDAEIIKMDYKDFELKTGKFGIGQVETIDISIFTSREDKMLEEMKKLQKAGDYHTIVLIITDIMKEGSQCLAVSEDLDGVAEALNIKFANNRVFVKGLMSRKKQIVPQFIKKFDK